jgi:hypothetical protein
MKSRLQVHIWKQPMTDSVHVSWTRSSQKVLSSLEMGLGQKKSGQSGSLQDHLPLSQRQMGAQMSQPPQVTPSRLQHSPLFGCAAGSQCGGGPPVPQENWPASLSQSHVP